MAKGTVKRKPTPSALRKKKAQQRIRKKMKSKEQKKKPNWRMAIAKVYNSSRKSSANDNHSVSKEKDSRSSDRNNTDANNKRKRSKSSAFIDGFENGDDVDDNDDRELKKVKFNFSPDDKDNNNDDNNDNEGVEVQSEVDEEKQKRMNERDPLETQLFLKNLPLDTNETELMTFFASYFGKIKRVLLVRNKTDKTLTGSGFVHCGSEELANKIFDVAQQNAREVASAIREDLNKQTETMSHHKAKKLKYKLRGNTEVARDPFLTLRDSKFTVHKVLSRSDTQEVNSAALKKKKRTKVAADDPRNLYLLQEGLILPDTPAAKGLHPKYMQMITDDYEARKAQLTNNNFFVSRTRLSVRNLPRQMTENDMRRLFAKAARTYLKTHPEHLDKEKWGKYGPIKNVKLLRDSVGVSKGYGFIEFVNHNVALHTLRALNNNPTLFGDHRRLMVSFSIENINAIQKLQRIKELKLHKRKAEHAIKSN